MARPERERDRWSITEDVPTYDAQGNTKPMQLAPIGRKGGGMVKKGGKSKVRGAGIARKGVRPAKMR